MAKKMDTIVAIVLDETGSMMHNKQQTVNSYNEYIQTLKKDTKGKVKVVLTKFNSNKCKVEYNKPLKDVPEMTEADYKPDMMTPLYDAIGKTIKNIEEDDKNKKVIFVIITDGEENMSKEYKLEDIKASIKEKEKGEWIFAFLGVDIDAYAEGGKIGIRAGGMSQSKSASLGIDMHDVAVRTCCLANDDSVKDKTFFDKKQ